MGESKHWKRPWQKPEESISNKNLVSVSDAIRLKRSLLRSAQVRKFTDKSTLKARSERGEWAGHLEEVSILTSHSTGATLTSLVIVPTYNVSSCVKITLLPIRTV